MKFNKEMILVVRTNQQEFEEDINKYSKEYNPIYETFQVIGNGLGLLYVMIMEERI